MLRGRADPPSPGKRSMGRRRTVNHDLPPHMARKAGRYYYVSNSKPRKWIPLGADLARAKRRWAELDAPLATPAELSVAGLVQRYIDRYERPHSTATQYASFCRCIAAAFPIPAAQLTSQHVALWRELPLQRARPAYTNGCIAVLAAAYRLGAECGQCQPLTVGKLAVSGRDRIIAPDEYRRIRAAAPGWLRIAMDLGYLTGARPSDLRALRWSQVGERIVLQQIKTGTRQEFVINDDLRSVFDAARARPICGLYVVANDKGRQINAGVFSRAWLASCKAAGVSDAQFRDIRAMAAKQGQADGLDYQALLGHASQAMSDHYLRGRRVVVAEPVRRKL
jgi:integrase